VLSLVGASTFGGFLRSELRTRGFAVVVDLALGVLIAVAVHQSVWALPFALVVAAAMHHALSAQMRADTERQKLADVIAASSDGIFTVDREGRVLVWNPALEVTSGIAAADAAGRAASELLRATVDGEPLDLMGDCPPDALVRLERPGGGDRWLAITRSALPEYGYVFVARDDTDRKRAEDELAQHQDELRQAQKLEAVGRLAGGIAHDFNNVLTAIMGNADLARLELPAEGRATEHLDEIIRAADHAATLTRQLLAYSRRQVLAPEPLDLGAVVDDIVPMLRRLVTADVAIATEVEPLLERVVADPTQLRQVIVNLVVNARDAIQGPGRILLRCYRGADGTVRLAVDDTGDGIEPEVREQMFEPFFTTKAEGKGTGLGLSTVHGIVAQSGGTIAVDSEPGAGTTITVALPAAPLAA
jgi:two-component system cell cycle sensor histidine kinase/response regulator CckA